MRTIAFLNTGKLVFGAEAWGTMRQDIAGSGHRRVFIVSTPHLEPALADLSSDLAADGIDSAVDDSIVTEPSFDDFDAVLDRAKAFGADCVLGIGGGSVLDVAKLLAAQLDNDQTLEEVVGIGKLKGRRVRMICVPTTSGTGSEVSPNALFVDRARNKVGVISPHLVPDAAYICPELTVSVPPLVTAATGVDALTHCLEAYANRFAHPMCDVLALEGIHLIAGGIEAACADGSNLDARTHLALGSVYGGMCLGPVNTAAVHALAYPLGALFHVPHGLSIALMLPYVMEFTLPEAVDRYADVARAVGAAEGGTTEATARNGIERLREIMAACALPSRLHEIDIPEDAIDRMARDALKVQRLLKNNPREVSLDDARAIYRVAA